MSREKAIWVRFRWNLERLPPEPVRPDGYSIRTAGAADRETVLGVILSAYRSDPIWQDFIANIEVRQRGRVAADLGKPGREFLVAECRKEIAAVSAVAAEHPIRQNLITGVCVADNHQRRGLGRYMMWRSLATLRDMGLRRVEVFSRKGAIAERKIYPLFGSERLEGVEYPDRLVPDDTGR